MRSDPADRETDWTGCELRALEHEESEEHAKFEALQTSIRQQRDMDGVCQVLEKAGAEFYEEMADCPEVQSLDLRGNWG